MATWDYSFWLPIVQVGILVVALLIGNTLRRKIPFIKNSLLPSSVIGGLLILALKFIPAFDNLINNTFMEGVTYHCLAIGFIALTLKNNENSKEEKNSMVVVKTGATVVGTYLAQAIVGIVITVLLSLCVSGVLPASGILMMLGFGQGSGQAMNFGSVYENDYGFIGGKSFGLTLAACGFLVACIIGVVAMNILKRQGKLKMVGGDDEANYQSVQDVSNPNDIPLTGPVDKLTINIGIVLGTYFLTYVFLWAFTLLIDAGYLGAFGVNTLKSLIWGFNFLFGTLFAILVKICINAFKKSKIMTRDYTNNFMLNRISGVAFDLMILAGIGAIEFNQLKGLWLPIVLLVAFGTIVTFVYLNFICKKLYPSYRWEAFMSLFGMLTGTASTGVILLREIDPKFETPASGNLVMQTVPAMIFGFPIMLLVGFAPKGLTQTLITLGIASVLFIGFTVFVLFNKKGKGINKVKSSQNLANSNMDSES